MARSDRTNWWTNVQRKQAPMRLLQINQETTLPRHLLIPWWDKPKNLHATVSKQNRTVVVVKRALSFSKRNHPTNTELWSLVSKDVYVHSESLWKPTYLKSQGKFGLAGMRKAAKTYLFLENNYYAKSCWKWWRKTIWLKCEIKHPLTLVCHLL